MSEQYHSVINYHRLSCKFHSCPWLGVPVLNTILIKFICGLQKVCVFFPLGIQRFLHIKPIITLSSFHSWQLICLHFCITQRLYINPQSQQNKYSWATIFLRYKILLFPKYNPYINSNQIIWYKTFFVENLQYPMRKLDTSLFNLKYPIRYFGTKDFTTFRSRYGYYNIDNNVTPRYSWNTAKVGINHQLTNQSTMFVLHLPIIFSISFCIIFCI